MFQFLNKIIRGNYSKRILASSSGQAAIILILIIAACLIYYAASANLGELSDIKAIVTVSSNTSAGILASYMASWGEKLSQEQLDGDDSVCELTDLFGSIATLLIVIITSMIAFASGQWYLIAIAILSISVSTASVVMQATIIQPQIVEAWNSTAQDHLDFVNQFSEQAISNALAKAVTDTVQVPDITDLDRDTKWVHIDDLDEWPFKDTVSRFSMYYDRRISQIVPGNATDIEDFMKALGHFLYEGGDGWGIHDHKSPGACDWRAECMPCCSPNRPDKCDDEGDDVFWVSWCKRASPYIDVNSATPWYPWVFDPTYENPDNAFFSLREFIGKDDQNKLFYKDRNDPNVGPPPNPDPPPHQLLYDGYEAFQLEDATGFYINPPYGGNENRTGIFPFFHKLAEWGVDLTAVETHMADNGLADFPKECHWYCKDPLQLGCIADCTSEEFREGPHEQPREIPQLVLPMNPDDLERNKTPNVDGSNPDFFEPGDPPLWVDKVTAPGSVLADNDICAMNTLYPFGDEDAPDPALGFWKEGTDQFCAPRDVDPVDNTTWPYSFGCSHHFGQCAEDPDDPDDPHERLCGCGDPDGVADPSEFPDDAIDTLYFGLGKFIFWAESLFSVDSGGDDLFDIVEAFGRFFEDDYSFIRDLHSQLTQLPIFYDMVYEWIEPNTTNWRYPSLGKFVIRDPEDAQDPVCYVCEGLLTGDVTGKEGRLFVFLKTMFRMRNRLYGWLVNHDWTAVNSPVARIGLIDPNTNDLVDYNEGYVGDSCTEVWCIPKKEDLNCLKIQPDERRPNPEMTEEDEDFDANRNGIIGDVADIVACLDHNVNHTVTYRGIDYSGNASRFDACFDGCAFCRECYGAPDQTACSEANCTEEVNEACGGTDDTYLPRSLLPGFDPNEQFDPIDLPRLPDLLACPDVCNACIAACQLQFDNCINCGDPPCGPCPNCSIDCGCPVDPDGDGVIGEFNCMIDVLPNGFEYTEAIELAFGSCQNLEEDSFLDLIDRSINEAFNQVAKFEKRLNYLSGRMREVDAIIKILDIAIGKFEAFLVGVDSPAQKLIQKRIDHGGNIFDQVGLPYHAIYGWRSETPPGGQLGKWHIVKVEARLPGRCDNACNILQMPPPFDMSGWPDLEPISDLINGVLGIFGMSIPDLPDLSSIFDPEWPDIEAEDSMGGLRLCYNLVNKEGVVKFRTTRYDEETGSGILRFPNGAKIWDFRFNHPERQRDTSPELLDPLCRQGSPGQSPTIKQMPNGADVPEINGIPIYDGAFMMNERNADTKDCWDLVHKLLPTGIVSETCAAYYWDDTAELELPPPLDGFGGKRMRFIFVQCAEF